VLVELTMTEQRYRAVLEVLAGVSVSEVAERFGFSAGGASADRLVWQGGAGRSVAPS
jgi:transposase